MDLEIYKFKNLEKEILSFFKKKGFKFDDFSDFFKFIEIYNNYDFKSKNICEVKICNKYNELNVKVENNNKNLLEKKDNKFFDNEYNLKREKE